MLFQELPPAQVGVIPVWDFVLNLCMAAVIAFLLSMLYVRHGHSLSNRRAFARNFVLITTTTMLIISVVKSSLALSLGLVGALSIVRFRAAIKEPEELAYLFLAIAVGLGLGADQRLITVIAFALIAGIIWLVRVLSKSEDDQNLYLTVASHNPQKAKLEDIVRVLRENSSDLNLKRFDDTPELLEAAFLIEFENFTQLEAARAGLQTLGDAVQVTFLDSKGLGGN